MSSVSAFNYRRLYSPSPHIDYHPRLPSNHPQFFTPAHFDTLTAHRLKAAQVGAEAAARALYRSSSYRSEQRPKLEHNFATIKVAPNESPSCFCVCPLHGTRSPNYPFEKASSFSPHKSQCPWLRSQSTITLSCSNLFIISPRRLCHKMCICMPSFPPCVCFKTVSMCCLLLGFFKTIYVLVFST
ncbi:hypothetical protein CRM22_009122 [Opisthorchis felineus]|uniref:Uncharacterized protein n=1 Tax=Opisthorchis felineus TaxID=147828 RepID=A0A4S2L827_OPIFE|nr:hypothetical protein CRM22_009122 [Opisthorchis felineus]